MKRGSVPGVCSMAAVITAGLWPASERAGRSRNVWPELAKHKSEKLPGKAAGSCTDHKTSGGVQSLIL